jgi:hypothetical protein
LAYITVDLRSFKKRAPFDGNIISSLVVQSAIVVTLSPVLIGSRPIVGSAIESEK